MNSASSKEKNTENRCSFCNAAEGKPRPLGQFVVELKPVGDKMACQSCYVHYNDEYPNRELKKTWTEKISRFFKKR